jgi:hypothetical protein
MDSLFIIPIGIILISIIQNRVMSSALFNITGRCSFVLASSSEAFLSEQDPLFSLTKDSEAMSVFSLKSEDIILISELNIVSLEFPGIELTCVFGCDKRGEDNQWGDCSYAKVTIY